MFEYLPNPYNQQTMYPCSNAQTRPKNGFTPVPDGTQTQSYINPRRNVDIWDKQLYLTPEERARCGLPPEDEPQAQVNNTQVPVNNAQVLPENAPQMQVNNEPQESSPGLGATILRKGEQVTSAMMNGLTQGYEDEIEGGLKAVGYGLANAGMRAGRALGADWQVPQEGVWDAMKRGYVQGRDARRQVLNDAYEEMPIISTGMETIGSIASPVNKLFGWQRGANPMAPRSMRIKANRNATLGTAGINAVGNSDDFRAGEMGKNGVISTLGSFAGYGAANGLLGRFGNDFARAVLSGGVAQPVQSGVSYLIEKLSK